MYVMSILSTIQRSVLTELLCNTIGGDSGNGPWGVGEGVGAFSAIKLYIKKNDKHI